MAEQRYQAVLAVIEDGRTVTEVAASGRCARQTVHAWLARYEAEGLDGLADRSRRPVSARIRCPARLRRWCWSCAGRIRIGVRSASRWSWRARTVMPAPSESAVYRCLVRAGVIEPGRAGGVRRDKWKRWERGRPMELWQLDVVGGFLLADGTVGQGVDRCR